MLDKIGIDFNGSTRDQYKSAFYPFTSDKFPDPIKENTTTLLKSLNSIMTADLASSRISKLKLGYEAMLSSQKEDVQEGNILGHAMLKGGVQALSGLLKGVDIVNIHSNIDW
jgi:hypothetical protein